MKLQQSVEKAKTAHSGPLGASRPDGRVPHRPEHHTQEQFFDDTTRDLDMYGASAFRDMAAAHFGGYPYLRGPLRNQPPRSLSGIRSLQPRINNLQTRDGS